MMMMMRLPASFHRWRLDRCSSAESTRPGCWVSRWFHSLVPRLCLSSWTDARDQTTAQREIQPRLERRGWNRRRSATNATLSTGGHTCQPKRCSWQAMLMLMLTLMLSRAERLGLISSSGVKLGLQISSQSQFHSYFWYNLLLYDTFSHFQVMNMMISWAASLVFQTFTSV